MGVSWRGEGAGDITLKVSSSMYLRLRLRFVRMCCDNSSMLFSMSLSMVLKLFPGPEGSSVVTCVG